MNTPSPGPGGQPPERRYETSKPTPIVVVLLKIIGVLLLLFLLFVGLVLGTCMLN